MQASSTAITSSFSFSIVVGGIGSSVVSLILEWYADEGSKK